jgi:Flp pilus assembly protein TadD
MGDLANEYRMARAASEAAPGDPYYVEDLAFLVIDKLGDFRQAVALLERARRASPEDVNVLSRLGHAYGFLGDHARSVEHYRRAIRLDPRDPRLLECVGWVLDRAGRTDEAIAEYRRAAALAPGRPSPHRLLAVAYEGAGRHHGRSALARALSRRADVRRTAPLPPVPPHLALRARRGVRRALLARDFGTRGAHIYGRDQEGPVILCRPLAEASGAADAHF